MYDFSVLDSSDTFYCTQYNSILHLYFIACLDKVNFESILPVLCNNIQRIREMTVHNRAIDLCCSYQKSDWQPVLYEL